MRDFTVELRLDSPLLQGGADGELDDCGSLRGREIRGMLRIWGRALLGPFFHTWERTESELKKLFGCGGSDGRRTFSVDDISSEPLTNVGKYRIAKVDKRRPLESCGYACTTRQGQPVVRRVRFSFHPGLFANEEDGEKVRQMVWAIAWVAFHLGSMGKRSRRCYGSLTLVGATGCVPKIDRLIAPDDSIPTVNELIARLKGGLLAATRAAGHRPGGSARQTGAPGFGFFQLASLDQIYLGKLSATPEEAVLSVLREFSSELERQGQPNYSRVFGKGRGAYRGSPLWVRLHRVRQDGDVLHLPVATVAPRRVSEGARTFVENRLSGTPLSGGES